MRKKIAKNKNLIGLALAAALLAGLAWAGHVWATAATADRTTDYRAGDLRAYPVEESTTIYKGTLVSVNAAGYAIPAGDTASTIFVGVAEEAADNGSGADGAIDVVVRTRGEFLFTATGISQAHVGSIMYIKYDNEFDNASSNYIACGRLVEYVSSTSGWIEIENAVTVGTTLAASAVTVADGDAHFAAAENTAEETIARLALQIPITFPRFTGWTKDGTAKTPVLPLYELPSPIMITAAYCNLGTAAGTGKTVTVLLNGSTVCAMSGSTITTGEDESLAIAVAADTNLVITVSETASGSGANCDVMLVGQLDDGE